MTFDALTITGIVWCALSGGFVLATAFAQAPRRSTQARPSALPLATRLTKRIAPAIGAARAKRFKPLSAAITA
jgi:hypothetical protein